MKKFIISSDALARALHKLTNAVHAKTVMPALSNIYCKVSDKSLEMICTNLETTIHYHCECETNGEEFEFLLPFQLISKIIALNKSCPLSFSLEKKGIKIMSDTDVYELKSLEKVESFPKLQELPTENVMALDETFVGWLKTALLTVGKDESRPALTKILLEMRAKEITIASSDGKFHMFSYTMNIPAKTDDDILINTNVIKAIDGLEGIELFWNKKLFAFQTTHVTVIVTRPDIKFVEFRKIIPADFTSNLTVNRHDLIRALEKCNISSDIFKETVINLKSKGKVNFTSKDTDYGLNISSDVAGEYAGTIEKVTINSDKMLKLMQQVEFGDIEIAIHDSTRPILFRSSDDPAYLGLLMTIYQKP